MGLSKKSKMNIGLALGALGVAGISALLAYGVRKADPRFYRTKFGPAVVCTMTGPDGRAVRLLLVGRSVQSATYVNEEYRAEPVFDYYLAFDLMFDAKPDIERVLMVGGGGYAYPKHIIATRPKVHMDVVEIDPAIIRIALTDFYLADYLSDFPFGGTYDLGRICADGCDYLADLSRVVRGDPYGGSDVPQAEFACQARMRYGASFGRRYDAMVFDVFAGKKPVASLASPTTIRNAHACLNPGSVLIANVVSALEGPKSVFLHHYVEVLEGEFAHVHVLPLSPDSTDVPDNVIVLATDSDWEFTGM